jgi:hypothetical protein
MPASIRGQISGKASARCFSVCQDQTQIYAVCPDGHVVWLPVKAGYACAAEDAVNTEKSCHWHDFESGRFGKKPDHIYAAGMRYSAALVPRLCEIEIDLE